MANHGDRQRMVGIINQLRALFQNHFGIFGAQAHQLFAAFADTVAAGERTAAEKVGVAFHTPAHTQIVRRYRAIGILANDNKALFRTQYVHGLGTVWRDAMRLSRFQTLSQTA